MHKRNLITFLSYNNMNQNTNTMNFITLADAKRQTGLSYLGSVNSSAKLKKNGTVSQQHTYSLYLAPASTSGYNVCRQSTPECRMGCLATSGRAGMELQAGSNRILNARIAKTRLFFEHQEFFMNWLVEELDGKRKLAKKQGFGFSARLNCTSDIDWANVRLHGKNIFEIFPDVQFYDYTKNVLKFVGKPENYHLTYSYTGRNWDRCVQVLEQGHNVAMVFNVRKETEIPETYNGYDVANGDLTDYRVNDAKGVIIGLKWKRIADKQAEHQVLNSVFVVNVQSVQGVVVNPKYLQVA